MPETVRDQLRRLVRDYERSPAHAKVMVNTAVITLMSRRLARGIPCPTSPGPAAEG